MLDSFTLSRSNKKYNNPMIVMFDPNAPKPYATCSKLASGWAAGKFSS